MIRRTQPSLAQEKKFAINVRQTSVEVGAGASSNATAPGALSNAPVYQELSRSNHDEFETHPKK